MQKGGTNTHGHSSTVGDGGALAIASTLLGTSLLNRFNSYRRPNLQFTSTTTVTVENNVATATTSGILFSDNDYREDGTASHRVLDVSRTAALSGTKQSGLRSGTVANNTWYAVYAVKASDNSTDWVAVADTVLPTQANKATLDTNFGSNSYIYLGMIRAGDAVTATNVLLQFFQAGNMTLLYNTANGTVGTTFAGIRLTQGAAVATLTYTATSGTGITDIPSVLTQALYNGCIIAPSGTVLITSDSANAIRYGSFGLISTFIHNMNVWAPQTRGFRCSNQAAGAATYDIFLAGWVDGILSGINPLI